MMDIEKIAETIGQQSPALQAKVIAGAAAIAPIEALEQSEDLAASTFALLCLAWIHSGHDEQYFIEGVMDNMPEKLSGLVTESSNRGKAELMVKFTTDFVASDLCMKTVTESDGKTLFILAAFAQLGNYWLSCEE